VSVGSATPCIIAWIRSFHSQTRVFQFSVLQNIPYNCTAETKTDARMDGPNSPVQYQHVDCSWTGSPNINSSPPHDFTSYREATGFVLVLIVFIAEIWSLNAFAGNINILKQSTFTTPNVQCDNTFYIYLRFSDFIHRFCQIDWGTSKTRCWVNESRSDRICTLRLVWYRIIKMAGHLTIWDKSEIRSQVLPPPPTPRKFEKRPSF
jgi:hypothetical protein